MSSFFRAPKSFEDLEEILGIQTPAASTSGSDMPLPKWYGITRKKPLDALSIEDLSIACRQRLFPQVVVPLVLKRLQEDPAAGEKYDWELLLSTRSVPQAYWTEHAEELRSLANIMEDSLAAMDNETRRDILSFMRHVGQ